MSDLVTLVDENEAFFSSVPVYVISPRRKKLAHATLKAVSMFSLSMLTGWSAVIFSRISFVIGKCGLLPQEQPFSSLDDERDTRHVKGLEAEVAVDVVGFQCGEVA